MICPVVRYLISRSADNGRKLAGLARRHVDRCPACRQFEQGLAELGRRLAEDAAATVPPVSHELHQRIAEAIQMQGEIGNAPRLRLAGRGEGQAGRRIRGASPVFWAYGVLAAAAAILLVVSLLYLNWHQTPQAPPPPVVHGKPPAATNDIFTLNEIIEAPSWVLTQMAQPIHEEVANLAEQGKRAAGFVLKQAVMYIEPDSLSLFNGQENGQSKG